MFRDYYSSIKTIRSKFLIVVIPLLLVTLAIITIIFDDIIRNSEINRLSYKLQTVSETNANVLAASLWLLDYDRLSLVLKAIVSDPEISNAAVYDENDILITSAGTKKQDANPELTTKIDIIFKNLATTDPIIVGRLEIALSDALVVSAHKQFVILSFVMALSLIVSVIASALIANRWSIGIPLSQLMSSIRYYEKTKDRETVKWSSEDEIGTIIKAYNSMQTKQYIYENELHAARDELEQRVLDRTAALVKARDEAELAKLSMSKFLANVSHELRTPLNAILGLSEFMISEQLGPIEHAKYKEYITDIHKSGHYLLELINDVLDLSKLEFGKMRLNESEFDLQQTINHVMRIAEGWTSNSNLTITSVHPGTPFRVNADERAIKQILLNLLSNAIKFSPENGKITVSITNDSSIGTSIFVVDNGQGIPQEDLKTVMEPFIQVDDPYTRKHKGTGLGLALVKSLTELHGGNLLITSEVGVGTTVKVTLPPGRSLN